ncbi:MAG: hypothetical protein HY690_15670 [Chloroflexi bacterium]|nr:hypothetical protein [Chloroflexota bacterium]
MSGERVDAHLVQRLAELARLSVDQAQAERLAPMLATLLDQAERLRALGLDGVEPAPALHLEERQP